MPCVKAISAKHDADADVAEAHRRAVVDFRLRLGDRHPLFIGCSLPLICDHTVEGQSFAEAELAALFHLEEGFEIAPAESCDRLRTGGDDFDPLSVFDGDGFTTDRVEISHVNIDDDADPWADVFNNILQFGPVVVILKLICAGRSVRDPSHPLDITQAKLTFRCLDIIDIAVLRPVRCHRLHGLRNHIICYGLVKFRKKIKQAAVPGPIRQNGGCKHNNRHEKSKYGAHTGNSLQRTLRVPLSGIVGCGCGFPCVYAVFHFRYRSVSGDPPIPCAAYM